MIEDNEKNFNMHFVENLKLELAKYKLRCKELERFVDAWQDIAIQLTFDVANAKATRSDEESENEDNE